MPNPKTTDQLRAIFGLGKNLGMDADDLRALAGEQTNGQVVSLKALSFDQANAMIEHLGGEAFPGTGHVAARTVRHHRQKANVKTMVTQRQIRMIDDLAAKRNMSEAGKASLCMRIIKKPKPSTSAQASKVIEALKNMNARSASVSTSGTKKEAA